MSELIATRPVRGSVVHARKHTAPTERVHPPRTLAELQRLAGNGAIATLVRAPSAFDPALQRFVASKTVKSVLGSTISKKWGKAIKAEGSEPADIVTEFIAWCDSKDQAERLLEKLTYEQYSANYHRAAKDVESELIGIREDVGPKEVDTGARIQAAIKSAGYNAKDFTAADLQSIETLATVGGLGWQPAVKNVYETNAKAAEDAELRNQRSIKYAATKAAGDLAFAANPLLMTIWSAAHGVAVAATASKNATAPGEYSDGQIQAAVALWHHHADIVLASNMHVPGGTAHPIQDKSTRPVNPDPTRGRQADFISAWGGGDINIHVDSNVHH